MKQTNWECGHCGETIAHEHEVFECHAPGCHHHGLHFTDECVCVGCVRECTDCAQDFCPEHVTTFKTAEPGFGFHLCAACVAKRAAKQEAA